MLEGRRLGLRVRFFEMALRILNLSGLDGVSF